MNNYKFDEVLQNLGGNPEDVFKRYKYSNGTNIMERISNAEATDIKELEDAINQVVLWKINRTVFPTEEVISNLYEIHKWEDRKDKNNYIKDLVTKMVNCKGIELAMASTLLHFFNPTLFPIFDQRAYRVLYEKEYKAPRKAKDKAEVYLDYLSKCDDYYEKHLKDTNIPYKDMDKYLYQLDKEAGNKAKNY